MAEGSETKRKQRGPGKPFQKGQSGNPGGMPKGTAEIRELCRSIGPEIIARLKEFALSGNPDHAIPAAKELLARGYGKAESYQNVSVNGTVSAIEHMTDAEIDARIKQLLGK